MRKYVNPIFAVHGTHGNFSIYTLNARRCTLYFMRFVLIFVDGLGVGRRDPAANPLMASSHHLLDAFQDVEPESKLPLGGRWSGLDAGMGVAGLPQSATGQTAILSGVNAAKLLGNHLSGFPNMRLRETLWRWSLLKHAKINGFTVDFLNTYRPAFLELPDERKLSHGSCSTVSALAAGIRLHGLDDLRAQKSFCHDLTNQAFLDHGIEAPVFTPQQCGKILAGAAKAADLVMFEFFLTDVAGHSQDMERAVAELKKLETFLLSVLSNLDLAIANVIVVSDHGNVEDLTTRSHTMNPSFFAVWGPGSDQFMRNCKTLTDPYHLILQMMKSR